MTDKLDQFIHGLDVQQPDWWITFASEQDMQHYVRETWTWKGKPAAPEHIMRVRDGLRRNVARNLILACRAAIEAKLVAPVSE